MKRFGKEDWFEEEEEQPDDSDWDNTEEAQIVSDELVRQQHNIIMEFEFLERKNKMKLLKKATRMVKSNRFFWFFSSSESKMTKIEVVYRKMLDMLAEEQ